MDKIKVKICAGTTCYLMGGMYLQSLEDHLEPDIKCLVEIEGMRCLGLCKGENYGKAPFVMINEEVVSEASLPVVIERINLLARGEGG
ncbi:MAG: NAD(P)H-dependent oxidoreductase subunit E [Armatimonadota bacterium]